MERIVEIPDNIKRTKVEPFGMASLTGWPVREEIVRCRDCQGFVSNATTDEYPHFCTKLGIDLKDGNGFCAWGERRG